MLTRLGQNGMWSGRGLGTPPALMLHHRRRAATLPTPGISTERGNPVVLPARESDSQEEPTGRRVKEEGASESRSVIDRIEGSRHGDITLTRKGADFPRVFRHERTLAN